MAQCGPWPPQRHTTVVRGSLDEWSARRRDLYLTKNTTDKHTCPWGIRTRNPSKQAVADPRHKPRGHWDRLTCIRVDEFISVYWLLFWYKVLVEVTVWHSLNTYNVYINYGRLLCKDNAQLCQTATSFVIRRASKAQRRDVHRASLCRSAAVHTFLAKSFDSSLLWLFPHFFTSFKILF